MEQKIQSFSCEIDESETSLVEESSQFLKQYIDFFGNMWKEQINRNQILRKLEKHAIKYSPEQYKPFSTSIQRKSKNSEIVVLNVVWGQFEQCISIINYDGGKVFNRSMPNYRSLGKSILYQQKIKGKSIMFKSQCFESNRNRAISSTIKQLFIAKIASALQFGPYCHQDTGFDVFIYDNCVQFGMEKCFNFSEKAHNYRCVDLKQGLFLMHHLKMIHFDIKPENIMYSSKFHKFVIIDFNLSDITNIKLGTKIKIGFRGTINYCSPDFVHNFLIPNEARLIDPYNNDIYCLRESLEQMEQVKIHLSFCEQDLSCIKFDEQHFSNFEALLQKEMIQTIRVERHIEDNDDEEQGQFQLLIIKRWLFSGEWKTIDNYFRTSQISDRIFNSLATFLFELDITDNLQRFYKVCIPERFKEAYEMIEFEYLIRRRWFISIGVKQAMNERRQQFEDRFEFTNPEEDSKVIQLSKVEAINYLLNEDKFVNSRVTYFSLFLKYVSFCENKFQVDAKERQQIGSKCNQFITKHCSSELQFEHSSGSQLEVAIVQIVGWITPVLKDKQQSERIENEQLVKDVVWKLLPFLFILDLGTVQQNLNWFHLILSSLEVKQDKAYMLLTLKNLNIWNKNRIGRKKGQSRFQVVSLVKQFVTEQLTILRSQSTPDLQKIIEFALRLNLKQSYAQCKIFYNGPHRRLKQAGKIEILDRFFEYSTLDLKIIENIYNMFHNGQNYEIVKHFCFNLFDRYRIMGENEFSHFVYQTFSRNLNDKQLEKHFRIYYENLSQSVLYPGNLLAQIKLVGGFLTQLEDEDLILSHGFVAKVEDIQECLDQRDQFSCQDFFRMQVQFSQVKSRLEGLIRNYQEYKQIGSGLKIHECFDIQSQFDLCIFNLAAYQDLGSYRSFLFELRKRKQYSICNFCEISIECFIIVCQQNWSLMVLPQNAHSIISKLLCDFQGIMQKSEKLKIPIINKYLFEQVSFHFLLNFACFCTQSKQYELEHHGIKRLYLQIKHLRLQRNVSYFWLYLGTKQICQLFLNITMWLLFEESPTQFLTFLKYLAEYLDKNLSSKFFNIILFSLQGMVLRTSHHNQLVLQNLVKAEARSNTNLPNLFSIFFYIFAVIAKDGPDRKAAFYRLTQCFSLLSTKLVSYYSTQIHRYFTLRLRKTGEGQLRQHFFLNNRLVKLLIETSHFQLIKHRKYPKFRNIFRTMLVSKLNKIEGPYQMKGNPPSLFYFQMKGTSNNKQ